MVDEVGADEQPIVVNPSATADMLVTAMRQLTLVGGGAVTIVGLVKGRDLKAISDYIMGDFGVFLPALFTVIAFVWGQVRTLRNKRKTVTIANAAPDSVAVVLEPRPLLDRGEALFKRLF